MLPERAIPQRHVHIEECQRSHEKALAKNTHVVHLPYALAYNIF